jgi:hypothetical protein
MGYSKDGTDREIYSCDRGDYTVPVGGTMTEEASRQGQMRVVIHLLEHLVAAALPPGAFGEN